MWLIDISLNFKRLFLFYPIFNIEKPMLQKTFSGSMYDDAVLPYLVDRSNTEAKWL